MKITLTILLTLIASAAYATCPVNMIDTKYGFCIDRALQSAGQYTYAVETCHKKGTYLCTTDQVMKACFARLLHDTSETNSLPNQWQEWTADPIEQGVGAPILAPVRTQPTDGCVSPTGVYFDQLTNVHSFRCCE